jgi:hypothetical protein
MTMHRRAVRAKTAGKITRKRRIGLKHAHKGNHGKRKFKGRKKVHRKPYTRHAVRKHAARLATKHRIHRAAKAKH